MDIKKENFKRISENRVNRIVTIIRQLQNLKNTSFYEYENIEIEQMFDVINVELLKTKKILINANDKGKLIEL